MSQIWLRPLGSIQAQPLAGTEGAAFPFWSPDGRFIGFFAGDKLKKIDITGGTPQTLADAPQGRGASWNRDDVIIFTPAPTSGIWRVSAAGGASTPVTALSRDEGAITHYWPQFLPDGRRFIYYQRSDNPAHQGIYVHALDSSGPTQLVRNSGAAVHVPGYLFFVRDGLLFAQAVDDRTLVPNGEPLRVADQIGYDRGTGGYGAVSAAGATLAYGPSVVLTTALQWRDRGGSPVGAPIARGVLRSPRLAPDGQRAALSMLDERAGASDIWALELSRGTFTRVTSDPSTDWFPAWDADGSQLFFGSQRTGPSRIFRKDLGGAGTEDPVTQPAAAGKYPLDTTRDGRLLYQEVAHAGYDLATDQRDRRPELDRRARHPLQRGAGPGGAERPLDRLRLG